MIYIDSAPDFKCNTYLAMQKLRPYLIQALDAATDELLKHMKIHVHDDTSLGPGKPEWRDELDRDLKKLYVQQSGDFIESAVGASGSGYTAGSWAMVRAMLIAYGSGVWSKLGSGEPIHFGPAGRTVWNDNLSGKHTSRSKRDIDAPLEFNHIGNDFIETAMIETMLAADAIMERAFKNMPPNLLLGVIHQ